MGSMGGPADGKEGPVSGGEWCHVHQEVQVALRGPFDLGSVEAEGFVLNAAQERSAISRPHCLTRSDSFTRCVC